LDLAITLTSWLDDSLLPVLQFALAHPESGARTAALLLDPMGTIIVMAHKSRKQVSKEAQNVIAKDQSIPHTIKQSYESLLQRLEICIENGVERSKDADEAYVRTRRDVQSELKTRATEKLASLNTSLEKQSGESSEKNEQLVRSLNEDLRASAQNAEKSEKDAAKRHHEAIESIRTEAAEGVREAFGQYVSDVASALAAADAAQLDTDVVAVAGSLLVEAAVKTHRILNA
jgi:uncharacterized membrane protein YgaE (UPF0421/DUF939 family)